jgi:amidase
VTDAVLHARLADLAEAVREGKVAARTLLESMLSRIERYDASVNAVPTLAIDAARLAADTVDGARSRGEPLPALAGMPITLKDSLETKGLLTTCGASQWSKHVPDANADVVQRLVDAGCVLLGKTNTPAYAADLQTYNPLFGVTRNPWDGERASGGSSGGAAAAVACGFSAFEIGSDIGGSIRNPAHCCGVYGHKPTYGLVPFRGHIPPPPGWNAVPDLAVVGPITRHADDLEQVLCAITDALAAKADPRGLALQSLRAAVWFDDPEFPLDHEVRERLERCVDALGKAGAAVKRAQPVARLATLFDDYLRLLWPVTTAHLTARSMKRVIEAGADHPEQSWHAKLARYASASHREWILVDERRHRLRARLKDFFRDYDVLLMPVSPVPAVPHDHSEDLMSRTIQVDGEARWYWEQLAWIAPATMSYLPATAAPVGLTKRGLPVGVQIVGAEFADRMTIHFARLMADVVGGFVPPPAVVA